MTRVVFLLEERSMKVLLEGLLPRCFPGLNFLCIPHEGKQDLEKSIPRKLRAWREPGVRFVIVRDQDREDCHTLKERLSDLCARAGRSDALVRIACQQLEAWYFGDPNALATAFAHPALKDISRKRQYRHPDAMQNPSRQLADLISEYQKISGARKMARQMTCDANGSPSFRVLIAGIRRLLDE